MIDYEAALSPRVKGIAPSGIRKFFDLLENMDSSDAISLGVGEPDFVTPWHIRDAGVYALEKGFTKYTSNAGLAELRREIAKYLNRRFRYFAISRRSSARPAFPVYLVKPFSSA